MLEQGSSIGAHFASLTDPRADRGQDHLLLDMVTVALCAVRCGADGWVAVATFGRAKAAWLRTFLALPGGIPSHDTFGRVFARLDPAEFRRCFLAWVRAMVPDTVGQVVALDGKTLRRSHDRANGKAALHMVSAWACGSGLVLGQVAVEEEVQRDHRHPRPDAAARPGRGDGDHRRAGLPDRHRRPGRRPGCR